MRLIFDDYDNIVIASPVHMGTLPAPMMSILSRFQAQYISQRFLNRVYKPRKKNGILILCGGGDGAPIEAIRLAGLIFKNLNALNWGKNIITSLETDTIPAKDDKRAINLIKNLSIITGKDCIL